MGFIKNKGPLRGRNKNKMVRCSEWVESGERLVFAVRLKQPLSHFMGMLGSHLIDNIGYVSTKISYLFSKIDCLYQDHF